MDPNTPAAETPTNPASDSVMGELISDHFASAEPAPAPEQAQAAEKPAVTAPEARPAGAEGAQGAAPAANPDTPEVLEAGADGIPRFKYRGKEFSVEDLRNDPKLLADLATGANQQAHFQKLAEERAAKLEEIISFGLEQARNQPQGQPAQPEPARIPQITPEMVRTQFAPVVKGYAEQGFIEPELAEIYPNTVAAMVWNAQRLQQVEAQMQGLLYERATTQTVSQRNQFRNYVDGTLDKIADRGEFFAPLKDPEQRQEFIGFIAKTNPMADSLNEDFLAQLWIAKNGQALLEAQKLAAQVDTEEKTRKRVNAKGEGRGPRPAAPPKVELTGQEAHMADLLSDVVLPAMR